MGNGNSIFVWVENWHPLIKRFGTRIISDAVSAADVKLNNYIYNGTAHGSLVWTLSATGKYSSQSVKEAIREHRSHVDWFKVVWFKGYVPRHRWCSVRGF